MSLFRSSLRPPAILSDEAVERYLEAIRAELTPDPLFRRRLRGSLVNRFVATREGLASPERPRQMGRLGRAVLYASFSLAVTVSTTMAASQASLPGDPLYPLKRQIEALRMEALPGEFHSALVEYALAERMEELVGLAEKGDWEAVERHALTVEAEYEAAVTDGSTTGALHGHSLVVLQGLIESLPGRAQAAIQDVLARVTDAGHANGAKGNAPGLPSEPGMSRGGGSGTSGGPADGSAGGESKGPAGNDDPGEVAETARPTPSPKEDRPAPTPRATRAPGPSAVPSASEPAS